MQVRESFLRDLSRLCVWYPLRYVILASGVNASYSIFDTMAIIHYGIGRNKARALQRAFTYFNKDNAVLYVKRYLKTHYRDRMQIFLFPRFSKSMSFRDLIKPENEHILKNIPEGRGVVFLHPHMGVVQLQNFLLSSMGYKIKQLGYPHDKDLSYIGRNLAFRLRLYYESFIPGGVFSIDDFLRPIVEWLKEGNAILTTGDGQGTRDLRGRYSCFPFLDGYYPFPTGAARLAVMTNSVIIPIFLIEREDRVYYLRFTDLILPEEYEGDEIRMTEVFIKRFEEYLSLAPWSWHFIDSLTDSGLFNKDRSRVEEIISRKRSA